MNGTSRISIYTDQDPKLIGVLSHEFLHGLTISHRSEATPGKDPSTDGLDKSFPRPILPISHEGNRLLDKKGSGIFNLMWWSAGLTDIDLLQTRIIRAGSSVAPEGAKP